MNILKTSAARTMKSRIENIVKIKSIKLIKGKCIEVSNNKYKESECAKIFKIRPHFEKYCKSFLRW